MATEQPATVVQQQQVTLTPERALGFLYNSTRRLTGTAEEHDQLRVCAQTVENALKALVDKGTDKSPGPAPDPSPDNSEDGSGPKPVPFPARSSRKHA